MMPRGVGAMTATTAMATTMTARTSMKMKTMTIHRMRMTMTTSRQLRPMRWKATNLTAIKEHEDRDAKERALLKSTPTTVC